MPNAILIILGSNYNPFQETQLGFIQELASQDYHINIYSIDSKPPPPSQGMSNKHFSLYRIQMELTHNNLQELIDQIDFHSPESDRLFIIDSIDFKEIKFGHDLKEKIQKKYPSLSDAPVIHFISPEYENPIFNNMNVDQFDFNNFMLTSLDRLFPFIKDKEKLQKVNAQIEMQSKKMQANKYNQIRIFMQSPGFNSIFSNPEETKKIIKEELMLHICKQIKLETLFQVKHSYTLK